MSGAAQARASNEELAPSLPRAWRLLQYLLDHPEGAPTRELAAHLGVLPDQVSKTMQDLEYGFWVWATQDAVRANSDMPCLRFRALPDAETLMDAVDSIWRLGGGATLEALVDDTGRDEAELLRVLTRNKRIRKEQSRKHGWEFVYMLPEMQTSELESRP